MVESLPAETEIRDSQLRGFGIRRQKSADVSYFVQRRVQGRMRRFTIGRHGSPWTTTTARTEASRLLLLMRAGGNPVAEREAARAKQMSFQELTEQFLEIHGPTLKPLTLVTYTDCIGFPTETQQGPISQPKG